MHINGDGANRAARRLAEKALNAQTHTITIFKRDDGTFRWGSNKGDWYSPVFDDVQNAFTYPEKVGLTKQDE